MGQWRTTGLRGLVGGPFQPLLPLITGALVVVAVVAAASGGPWTATVRRRRSRIDVPELPELASPSPPAPPPDGGPSQMPDLVWVRDLLAVIAGLVLVAVFAVLVRKVLLPMARRAFRVRRDDPPADTGTEHGAMSAADAQPDVARLREGLREASARLADVEQPADAVIAAWVALERAAERSGVERAPAHTPTEFTLHVLDATPADPAAARSLLSLYHRARFSRHGVVATDVARAAEALARLGDGLDIPDDDVRTVFDIGPEDS